MNRLHRLYRSAIVSFAGVVGLLLFTVPASREFVAGNPFMLYALTAGTVVCALAGALFLAVADKVAEQTC